MPIKRYCAQLCLPVLQTASLTHSEKHRDAMEEAIIFLPLPGGGEILLKSFGRVTLT